MNKKYRSLVLALLASCSAMCACAAAQPVQDGSRKAEDTAAYERSLESLGAFEISSTMLRQAANNEKGNAVLNAGRGNPNWINALGRAAFSRILELLASYHAEFQSRAGSRIKPWSMLRAAQPV